MTEETLDNTEMEAAFAASFDEKTPKPEVKQESKPEPKPEESPELKGGLSDDQVKVLQAIPEMEKRLMQQVDRVSGNYGEIKRLLDGMQKASATPQGAATFVESDDGDILNEFGEDFSKGVDQKINRALQKLQSISQPTIDPKQIEEVISARENARIEADIKALDDAHPDRLNVIKTPEWAGWLNGLPEYERVGIMRSKDLHYVSGALSRFKDHMKQAAEQAAQKERKEKERLERAIPTRGTPSAASFQNKTDEEAAQAAFEAQFKT